MKRVGAALSAATVLAGLQLAGPAASAAEPRPCVSRAEFQSVHVALTRSELEARWHVAGTGRRVSVPGLGSATQYRRCGESRRDAWYGVGYVPEDGRLYGYTLISYRAPKPAAAPGPTIDPTPCPECSVVSARGREPKRVEL